jgi:hypothetical protein
MFVIAIVGLALILGGTWWLGVKLINNYTSAAPISIPVATPTEAEFSAANDKMTALREAMRNGRSIAVEFSATDLNSLLARAPEFDDMRGKFHVAMADSIMTLDMSLPLSFIEIRLLQERYLNGTARFGLAFNQDSFNFSLRSLTVNEREVPMNFVRRFDDTLSDSVNEGVTKSRRENRDSDEFWENVKSMAVDGDKLLITTKGMEMPTPEASDDATADEAEATPTPDTL